MKKQILAGILSATMVVGMGGVSVFAADDKADDKPIKVNDHLMDALRYGVRTMRLVKPKEEYKSPFFA